MSPFDAAVRSRGFRFIRYVDDLLLIAQPAQFHQHARILLDELHRFGWVVRVEKCELEPEPVIEFSGHLIDVPANRLHVTATRRRNLVRRVRHRINSGRWCLKTAQRLLGTLQFTTVAVPMLQSYLADLYSAMPRHRPAFEQVPLHEHEITALRHCIRLVQLQQG